MPRIATKYQRGPIGLFNKHLQTIYPSLFRKFEDLIYDRERLELDDGDFLDLDWKTQDSKRLVIVSHGLEGSSDRHYVKGTVKAFIDDGWDALAWNCRSCSGEMNRLLRLYHHGATDDLKRVVSHVESLDRYETVVLVGFSMGGGLTLKYLGEESENTPSLIKAAVAISVPVNLVASLPEIEKWGNYFYKRRFLRKLTVKVKGKAELYPDVIDLTGIDQIRNFDEFDNRYSAPINGFKDAKDFYSKVSAHPYVPHIRIPTLILNAWNDPLLSPECFPEQLADEMENLYLETPKIGGHVGFLRPGKQLSYADIRALEFCSSHVNVKKQTA
ncbi:MAG: alpha/beta fold hydrolase [Bacteroidota bacterium]